MRFFKFLLNTAVACIFSSIAALTACSALGPPPPLPELDPSAVEQPATEPGVAMSERAHALREANANVSTVSSAPDGIRIHVFRGGRAANLGHNHVLTAPRFTGYLAWPAQSSQPPSFELLFRLDELVLDDPDLRRRLGGAYASTLSPAAVDATRNNMLGAGGLNAQRYPWVHIRSMNIVGEGSVRVARVAINLHGQTREQWLVIQMAQDPAGATDQASGSLVLRQTDFGALPFSVGGGLLSIQDELAVVFQVHSP